MFKILCRDMGIDCAFEAMGATAEEALGALKDHGMAEHGEAVKAMAATMSEAEMTEKMKSVMTEG